MPTLDIIVDRRKDDYKAYLADNDGVWESGKTDHEAVGKLVMSAGHTLGISVQRGSGFHHPTSKYKSLK